MGIVFFSCIAVIFFLLIWIDYLFEANKFKKECLKRRDEDIEYLRQREEQLLKSERELLRRLENQKTEIRWNREL